MTIDGKENAQLAAIQGGMGEDVAVLATVSMGGVEYGIGGAELGDIDIQPDMKALCALQQSLVTGEDDAYVELIDKAQHQRITAAMAAEVERLREERDSYRDMSGCMDMFRKDMIERGVVGEQCPPMFMTEGVCSFIGGIMRERDALRAELAEVKGREAVGEVVQTDSAGGRYSSNTMRSLTIGTKLYTTPPASPDVEGLVKALEKVRGYTDSPHVVGVINAALSTWRQAHVSQQKGKA